MTEWTIDRGPPAAEIDPIEGGTTVPDAGESPYSDLVSGALIEDVQLDRADWLS